MTRPLLACVGLVTVAIMSLAPVTAAGQAPPAGTTASQPAKPYAPPRTPDGQPDIQGFWTNSTYTPLQRPKGRDQGVLHAALKRSKPRNAPPPTRAN